MLQKKCNVSFVFRYPWNPQTVHVWCQYKPSGCETKLYSGNIRIKRKTASLKMLKCLLGSNNQLVMTKLLLPMLRKTKLNELAEKVMTRSMHFVQKEIKTKWVFYLFCLEKNLKRMVKKLWLNVSLIYGNRKKL